MPRSRAPLTVSQLVYASVAVNSSLAHTFSSVFCLAASDCALQSLVQISGGHSTDLHATHNSKNEYGELMEPGGVCARIFPTSVCNVRLHQENSLRYPSVRWKAIWDSRVAHRFFSPLALTLLSVESGRGSSMPQPHCQVTSRAQVNQLQHLRLLLLVARDGSPSSPTLPICNAPD